MGFSVFVEIINLRVRDKHVKPVNLREPYREEKLALQPVTAGAVKTDIAQKQKPKSKKKSVTKKK
jgi:hypothetical protein